MTTLTVSTHVEHDVARFIGESLNAYNHDAGGPHNDQDLWIVARDSAGAVVGGLKASSEYGWLFVEWLWIDAAARQQRLGSELLGKAEDVARERGCIGVHLDSYTFQAPEFYKRHGYEEFGRIDDYPPGHSRVWLKKRL